MVIKIGIDQITRSHFTWRPWNENWVSADWINDAEPDQTTKIPISEKRFNYGFNDFVVVECTPELAWEVKGVLSDRKATQPPQHVRASRADSNGETNVQFGFWQARSCYSTMAWGWGTASEVLDQNSSQNLYCDVEGPPPSYSTDQPFVRYIALVMPGGLKNNDTFWIDLNKGVRALYFPARYVYNDDFPNDAAYAKISFVEDGSRQLIDASDLMFMNDLSKVFGDTPLDLHDYTRQNTDVITLEKKPHLGAFSVDSTIIVNIPQFIESSFLVAYDQTAKPHDAVYLAKSADLKATRVPPSDDGQNWRLPPEYYKWEVHTQQLSLSYSAELSSSEQVNMKEVTTSRLSLGEEFALSVLLMAASLIPYVGPLVATIGSKVLDNMKDIRSDSSDDEVAASGIAVDAWNALPGEAKEKLAPQLAKTAVKLISVFRR